jgi:hypothetical protein
VNRSRRPVGIILLIIFFAVGALICSAVMLALAFPGTALETIWRLRDRHRCRRAVECAASHFAKAVIPAANCDCEHHQREPDPIQRQRFNSVAACLSAESVFPPSIRAISSWRAFPATSLKRECVRPPTTSLVTTNCVAAAAATCGK